MKQIVLEQGIHRERDVVFIVFEWDIEITSALKRIKGLSWSHTQRKWYIPAKEFNLNTLQYFLKGIAEVTTTSLSVDNDVKNN